MNAVAYAAFAVMFLICTVVVLGFVLVAWLGWTLGLLWVSVPTPFLLFFLWRLYGYTSLRSREIQDGRERRSR
jgi:hypothetical protein